MRTASKCFLLLFASLLMWITVRAQKCPDVNYHSPTRTYTIPTPSGKSTASALLEEYQLSQTNMLSDCTILINDGVDFEIDISLSLNCVTVIASEGCGIKVSSNQTLVVKQCKLIPEEDKYWNGIVLEDETAKLLMNNTEVSYALNPIHYVQTKN